jgi:hypothetical protein
MRLRKVMYEEDYVIIHPKYSDDEDDDVEESVFKYMLRNCCPWKAQLFSCA